MKNHTIEGYEAYLAGKAPKHCPYAQYSDARRHWDEGWHLAAKHTSEDDQTCRRLTKDNAELRNRLSSCRKLLQELGVRYEKLWREAARQAGTHVWRCCGCAVSGAVLGFTITHLF